MAPLPDHYSVLGVPRTASTSEIRTAYKKKVLTCHPDKEPDESLKAQKQEQFQKVQAAYETVYDPTKRAKYDEKLRIQAERAMADRFANVNLNAQYPTGSSQSSASYFSGRTSGSPPTADTYSNSYSSKPRTRHNSPQRTSDSLPTDFGYNNQYSSERARRHNSYEKPPRRDSDERKSEDKKRRERDDKSRKEKDGFGPRRETEKDELRSFPESSRRKDRPKDRTSERERDHGKGREREKEPKSRHSERKSQESPRVRQQKRDNHGGDYKDDHLSAGEEYTKPRKSSSHERRPHSSEPLAAPETVGYAALVTDAEIYILKQKSTQTGTPQMRTRRMSEDSAPKKPRTKTHQDGAKPSLPRANTFASAYTSTYDPLPMRIGRSTTMDPSMLNNRHSSYSPRTPDDSSFPQHMPGYTHYSVRDMPGLKVTQKVSSRFESKPAAPYGYAGAPESIHVLQSTDYTDQHVKRREAYHSDYRSYQN